MQLDLNLTLVFELKTPDVITDADSRRTTC